MDNQSIKPRQPTPLPLPSEIFLILGTHLDTRSLSRLSRTCRTLHTLLAFQLKRHHLFRLVGRHLFRCDDFSYVPSSPFLLLSRTCRTVRNALAPHVERLLHHHAPAYIGRCIELDDYLGVARCLASFEIPSTSVAHWTGPLWGAVDMRRKKIVEILLEHGEYPQGLHRVLRLPLRTAIANHDKEIVRMLLEKGAPIDLHVWKVEDPDWAESWLKRLLDEYGIDTELEDGIDTELETRRSHGSRSGNSTARPLRLNR